MSFQSLSFLAFFALTLAVCLAAGRKNVRAGKNLLFIASAVFYLWGFGRAAAFGFAVLLAGTAVTAAAVRYLTSGKPERGRKRVLTLAVLWHAAVLLTFKYTGFLTGGAVRMGWAPLGLSFFTFQQIWCLKEVYDRRFRPETTGDFELFAFFFPTVASGPILKPQDFFPQLAGGRFLHPDWSDAAAGLYAIALGMGKKVLLADSFGVIVDNGYARLPELSAPAAWLVILGYTLQLYFDFSGYCDIAAGLARLLGLRLPVNFDSPYRALSVGEFWKRWHITLTSFLRECLYFPLGGSRRGSARTYRNILLVFLISGFWHGAGWTFVLWGGLHGLGQVAERAMGARRDRLPRLARWALTFAFVNAAWVFFRAPSARAAVHMLRAAVSGGLAKPQPWLLERLLTSEVSAVKILLPALTPWCNILLITGLYGVGLLAVLLPGNTIRRMDTFRPTFLRALALSLLLAWSILSFTGITSFIYSNF
jgi:D-alanyl-lipoteichoic acid acyltransferase DltB (MBOAT superfamily)